MAAICVYCASSESIDERFLRLAAEVGTALARAGHTLVFGGGRASMMGALAAAARAGGAHTVGVIPESLMPRERPDLRADELLVVRTMRDRKRIMDERSDAVLALPGGLGTLEELLEMWTSAYLGMHAKPVIVLDPNGFYAPLWTFVDSLRDSGFVSARAIGRLHRVSSVEQALQIMAAPRQVS
jgi:uncharacterized protein (TIGR00730 family)